jgi:hypothetical protein
MKIIQLADTPGTMMSYGQMQFQAQCPTHGTWVKFTVSYTEYILADATASYECRPQRVVIRAAEQAIKDQCSGCVEDAARVVMPASRWPEGAEL